MSVLTRMAAMAVLVVLGCAAATAATRKPHVVALGAARRVPYSKAGDPAGARAGEKELLIRALSVDGEVKEWTTGEAHDVTDRSFVVRRAIRINDTLPDDRQAKGTPLANQHWVWQRGPWLVVDRENGRVSPLKLPDLDPGVSQVTWFRDYAAYCGLTPSGKSLYAVVAQVSAHKALFTKRLSAYNAEEPPEQACETTEWQRNPMRVTFHPTGQDAVAFELAPGSAVLVEGSADNETIGRLNIN